MVQVVPPEGYTPQHDGEAVPIEPSEAEVACRPVVASAPAAEPKPAENAVSDSPIEAQYPPDKSLPVRPAASPAELQWRKWLILGAAPVVAAVVLLGFWSVFSSSARQAAAPDESAEAPAEPAIAERPAAGESQSAPASGRLDRRWLPDRTVLVFSLGAAKLAGQPNCGRLIAQADALRRETVGPLLRGLGLELDAIERLTWASTDLADWNEQSVVVIRLEQGRDARAIGTKGEPVGLSLDGVACRRLGEDAWPHPFAILDERTIVSGTAALLRELAARQEPQFNSAPVAQLLKTMAADSDAVLLVDLAAARSAGRKPPDSLFDVWPAGSQRWRVICGVPAGLGCTLHYASPLRAELALVCQGETAAENVGTAVGQLIRAAEHSLTAQRESIGVELQSGNLTAATAGQYELLLDEGIAAFRSARHEVAKDIVWVRLDFRSGPTQLASLAIDSRQAIRSAWLSAALGADEANHRRLMAGLTGYQKSEGHFPEAARGSALLAPETRLSWIAAMLPYLGHGDWHRQLQLGYSWNSPQNRPVTQRPLPQVINPALGPEDSAAGFPVTHYVGIAGIGAGAGRLKASDPRAGVFGYGRTTRPQQIADGAANTIAVLGVSKKTGAWASGGNPTVRPLTAAPYVNGPDGFGSGQPGGMLAGMADGSVRFISENVDARVLEQLATVAGHEPSSVAVLNLPRGKPQPPKPAGEQPAQPPQPQTPEPDVPAQAPPQVADRPAVKTVDLRPRLAATIPEISLQDVPLGEAVELLSAIGAVPVAFDPEAMQRLAVSPRDPITVNLRSATVGSIIEAIASQRGLSPVVEQGVLLLSSPPQHREELRTIRYTVSDLTRAKAAAMAELAAVVQRLVAPDSWLENGGRGLLQTDGGALLVTQTLPVHDQVLVFCEKLRNARGKPLRSRGDPDRFALLRRRGRAAPLLGRKVTANFHDPAPLKQVLAFLGQACGAVILIDEPALRVQRLTSETPASLAVEKQPLDAALETLLGPLGLSYRVVDARTLQVTTRKTVEARLELEFYPVAKLLEKGTSAEELIEQVKGRVAGNTWSDAGGPGVIHFDTASRCLLVLQSQPVHAAIEHLLLSRTAAERP